MDATEAAPLLAEPSAVDRVLNLDELLETIFTHLCASQLAAVSQVCKKWSYVAQGMLAKRSRKFGKVCYHYMGEDCSHHMTKMSSFTKYQLALPPRYGLVFTTQALKVSKKPCCHALALPASCQVYSTVGYGIIGTTSAGRVVENEEMKGVACLFIPKLGDFELTPVFLHEDVSALCRQRSVKVFIIMHSTIDKCSAIVEQFTRLCPDIVVAGGFVTKHLDFSHISSYLRTVPSSKLTSNYPLVGFAVSGQSVRAASVVLTQQMYDRADIVAAFEKLRRADVPRNGSTFALVFSCNGRGRYHYGGQKNVEADEFMKAFPGVPLIGFYGHGEVGHEHVPTLENYDDGPVSKQPRRPPYVDYLDSITRSYSSVFVLISAVK